MEKEKIRLNFKKDIKTLSDAELLSIYESYLENIDFWGLSLHKKKFELLSKFHKKKNETLPRKYIFWSIANNNFDVIEWCIENGNYKFNPDYIETCVNLENSEMINYLYIAGCEIEKEHLEKIFRYGNDELIRNIYSFDNTIMTKENVCISVREGHISALEFSLEIGMKKFIDYSIWAIRFDQHLILQYLIENNYPIIPNIRSEARKYGSNKIIAYSDKGEYSQNCSLI